MKFVRNEKRIKIDEERFVKLLEKYNLNIYKLSRLPRMSVASTIKRQLRDPDGMTYELIFKIDGCLKSSFHEPSITKTCSDCGLLKRLDYTKWCILNQ